MTPTDRKKQIKALWQKCFDDTEEFVEFYFSRVYKDANAMSIERDGKIVSALQMIPYTMTWCDTEITLAYISGACTDPAYRGKGLMGELLHKSFHEMHRLEYDITALIPANAPLFEFYRPYGYTEIFNYTLQTIDCETFMPENYHTGFHLLTKESATEWFPYFDRKLREHSSCVLHTLEDFTHNIIDTTMAKGHVVGLTDEKNEPIGIVFTTATEEEAYIKEIIYEDDRVKSSLLYKVTELYRTSKIINKTLPSSTNSTRYGMAMVLNKEKMIWQWLNFHPDTLLSAEELNQMDVQSLTYNLLGYGQKEAYMSLMMD